MPQRPAFPVVAHVLFEQQGKFALFRRSATGFMDGWYALPGGHQESGESVEEAAARECQEEVGVTTQELKPLIVMPYISGRHQGTNFVFLCEAWHGDLRMIDDDFDDLRWCSEGDVPTRVVPWLSQVLEARRRPDKWFASLRYSWRE